MNYPKNRKPSGTPSQEHRDKISRTKKGVPVPEERKQRISATLKSKHIIPPSRLGSVVSLSVRKKISEKIKGKNHYNWKGGITGWQKVIRRSLEYRLWREAVFKRDKYTCIWCGEKGIYLHADHIKPFAYFPELRFSIDNGRTLCKECHLTTFKDNKTYAK